MEKRTGQIIPERFPVKSRLHKGWKGTAYNALFVGMSNQLGDFRAGMAAALIGAIPAVMVGGIGTLLTVLFCIKIFPELYEVEGFHTIRKQ